jgi:hypothetical protein
MRMRKGTANFQETTKREEYMEYGGVWDGSSLPRRQCRVGRRTCARRGVERSDGGAIRAREREYGRCVDVLAPGLRHDLGRRGSRIRLLDRSSANSLPFKWHVAWQLM